MYIPKIAGCVSTPPRRLSICASRDYSASTLTPDLRGVPGGLGTLRGWVVAPSQLGRGWLRLLSTAAGEHRAPQVPPAGEEGAGQADVGRSMRGGGPGWRTDRLALFRYRLTAARYGLRIRMMRPFGDMVGVAGLLLGLVPFAALLSEAWRAYGVLLMCLMAVAAWPSILWLGRISAIMRAAASTEEGTRQVFADMRAGMRNCAAYALLRRIYEPVVEDVNARLDEQRWPCRLEFAGTAAAGPKAEESEFASVFLRTAGLADLTSLLGNLVSGVPDCGHAERRAESRQRLMRRWRALQSAGRPMDDEDGSNYCLAEVRLTADGKTPQLRLDLGIAEYGQIARTSEALVNEFALFAFLLEKLAGSRTCHQAPAQSAMRPGTALRCMPWRKKAHDDAESAGDLFLRPRHRAAGLGVAVATVVTTGGEPRVFVGERSGTVGTYPNVMHVVPAGNCNTNGSQRLIEHTGPARLPDWYLRTMMRSEYLEEWFNDVDLETSRFPYWAERVDQGWAAKVSEITPITLTGIAFDLLNLRPEVCAVTEVAMNGNEVLNWEFAPGSPLEAWPLQEVGTIQASDIVQGGAAVLLLAKSAVLKNQQGAK
jgi:hypothetical protein